MLRRYAAFVAAAGLIVTVGCAQSDTGITTAVESKLTADQTVSAYQIDVDTQNGVVTLTGTVETPEAKEQALMIARDTDGVTDVIDQIEVGRTAPTTGDFDPDFDVDAPDVDLPDVDAPDVDVDVDTEGR